MHFNLIMEKQNESQMYSEGKMQHLLEKVDDFVNENYSWIIL